ncbi:spindle pole body interacting protein [Metschnikowia bicuspidata var. bicuspidata NRRL YB-4993]|uniref:Spindle pole body interacting protein n=1 Tax=Metschnikowia bicuspidata var. bicuspidata NRRL YB-4993 TaxID=869754 RepID=A0A1A0H575_9ASCO|nr:spindle pole body interacting protein [Metschnikowia bicuspidata var. bicuspidata NRRL YB-4993]OBA19073.1 spindle pole body interacting protein [Metschnikowia bicuspidata var. bicuspidata NRRL YB-4993]
MTNIDYIISSEFHVDKGPSIIHQYPSELPGLHNLPFFAELLIPDQIHKREEDYTLILLHRNKKTGDFEYKFNSKDSELEPYFVYTIVNNVSDSTVKRGSVIKALSLITKLVYFKHFKPLIIIGLDRCYANSSENELKQLYNAINCKNFQVSHTNHLVVKKLLITSILDLPLNEKIYFDEAFRNRLLGIKQIREDFFIRRDLSFNSIVSYNNMKIPVKLPILLLPDTIGDYLNPTDLNFKPNLLRILDATMASNVHNNELTIYGHATPPIIVLINAMLTGKKIIFMSYENSAGYIIDHVLLALKLITGGGILTGLLTHYNVFPIIDVSKISLLSECDSYIAGTINPFFKSNDKLWDLFIDLDKNEFHISPEILESEFTRHSIVGEDAKFLSNMQLSLYSYNDDLTTLQLIIRRHINEIVRILLFSKNYNPALSDKSLATLLMDGVGYYWHSDTTKLLEVSCYQSIASKFQNLLYSGIFGYSLNLPNLSNELDLMVDLQHYLQKLNNVTTTSVGGARVNEREIWFNILKYLISGRSLETFMLMTYLMPPNTSTSFRSSSHHGGGLTVFDKNKGMELLFINLFNADNHIKSNIIMIMQELQDNFLCGWCLNQFLKSNLVYQLAFEDLTSSQDQNATN